MPNDIVEIEVVPSDSLPQLLLTVPEPVGLVVNTGTPGPQGIPGNDGADGTNGTDGADGTDGTDGNDGLSAYDIAVANGFVGTQAAWLASLAIAGEDGTDGISAYQVAVNNGFVGNEAAWLASLEGTDGTDGTDGTNGTNGTDGATWRDGAGVPSNGTGVNGDYYLRDTTGDVYQRQAGAYVIVANIKGAVGTNGADGTNGTNGTNGATWRSGSTVPSNALGVDGDYYFRTTTGDVYLKTAGAYTITANIKGADGTNGTNGTNGTDGANAGNKYTFNSATSGDPASGKFLFNNATFLSATTLNISETDGDGAALAAYLAAADDVSTATNRSIIRFKNAAGTKGFSAYITSAITDNGTYDTFNITPIGSWGSPANGDVMYMTWGPSGPKGDTGAAGAPGAPGASGGGSVSRFTYTFDTTTTDADPGAGKFRFSNTSTFASRGARTLYISTTDAGSNDISAFLAALTASDATKENYLDIESAFTVRDKRFVGRITSVTAASGYYKIGLQGMAQIDTSPPFVNASSLTLGFSTYSHSVPLPMLALNAQGNSIQGIPGFTPFRTGPLLPAANTTYFIPFVLRHAIYTRGARFRVGTAATAGTGSVRVLLYRVFGRYADGPYIDALVTGCDSGIMTNALASTGIKDAAWNDAFHLIPPGYYALALAISTFSGSPSIDVWQGMSADMQTMYSVGSTWKNISNFQSANNFVTSLVDPADLSIPGIGVETTVSASAVDGSHFTNAPAVLDYEPIF